LAVRKGLGGSFELGVAVQWLTNSEIMAVSGELRWAVVEGLASAPDVALRLWGARMIGAEDLDLVSAGADAMVSKSFGVAGMIRLQPYGSLGVAMVNASSSAVDFKPAAEDPSPPARHPLRRGEQVLGVDRGHAKQGREQAGAQGPPLLALEQERPGNPRSERAGPPQAGGVERAEQDALLRRGRPHHPHHFGG